MEQRAVDDRVELPVEAGERGDVGLDEFGCGQATLLGRGSGRRDGGGGQLDTHHGVAAVGERKRQLGVSTAGIEHLAPDLVGVDQRGQFRLRLTDVPRRRPLELALLPVCVVPIHHLRHGGHATPAVGVARDDAIP